MKKGKSIVLLSILSVLMAFLLVITFVRFEVGVKNFNSVLGAIDLDYDIAGGNYYTFSLSKENIEEVGDNVDDVVKTIENRMTNLGYSAFKVKAVKSTDEEVVDYNIVIEAKAPLTDKNLPDMQRLNRDVLVATAFGQLKFYGDAAANPSEDKEFLLDGSVIKDAKALKPVSSEGTVYYQVSITFTDYAMDVLNEKLSENNDKFYLKMVLGDTVLLDASSNESYITSSYFNGNSIVLTTSSEDSAKQTALQIKSGGLAYKYEMVDAGYVSAQFGENLPLILTISISALVVILIALLIIKYKYLGVVFGFSLVYFMLLEVLMLIAVPGIKLSFGGIVGIVLSMLLACDGFVMIINRINEEFEKGKTVKSAIKNAFSRSILPIVSVGVISGVVALALYSFTTGVLQGFAITFGIGAVLSVVTGLLFTRLFTAIIMPLVKYNEKALNLKRVEG